VLLLSLVAIGTACHKPYFFFKSGIYRKIVALPWIYVAGALQLIIAAANLFVPEKLGYGESLKKVSPIVRQIFIVHCAYIVWVLLAFALICFLYPVELAGGRGLGRLLSGWMALFWGVRVFIQRFYYEKSTKQLNRPADIGFTLAFAYLSIIFALASWGGFAQ